MAPQGKKLINHPSDVVTEYIEGLVEAYPGLQYLDGFPQIKVVLQANVSPSSSHKVAVISGGGAGHEPAHAGYVGPGMLTAAVSGDVFASPPVDSILAAIRAVTGAKGCVLIVTNYTGDRLNFGLAAEQAKSEGYRVEMVIIGDDCALLPGQGIGRRGLAGTVLVNKIAGAAAAAGLSLKEVAAEAKHAAELVGTMGVALSVCTLPGQPTSDRLGSDKMELGLGIHGEPGIAVVDIQPVDQVVSHVLNQILSVETGYVPITSGSNVVLMINGLGGTPLMELMIAARKAVRELEGVHGIAVDRVYTGSFMTSLDMAGFSITVMKSEPEILERLDTPTKAPCWPVGTEASVGGRSPKKVPLPSNSSSSSRNTEIARRPKELTKFGCILEAAIEAAAKEIISIKDCLNEWDTKVGDGDCGTTMDRGASAITEDIKYRYPLNDAAETLNEMSSTIQRVMGGTSGILYAILGKATYMSLKGHSQPTAREWANALAVSIDAVSKYGGACAGYRTMLDALIPASTSLHESLDAGDDPVTAFVKSAEAAMVGAESTKNMRAQAGRSSYISPDLLISVPDPGAMAAASWYRAAALSVASKLKP